MTSVIPAEKSASIARRSRSTFEQSVRDRLSCEVGDRVRSLDVEQIGREVVVSGIAPSYYVKQMITHAVMPEIGELTLTNAVRVAGSY